eukprot:gene17799-21196_t
MVFSLFGDAISRFFSCILCGADPDLVFAYSTVRIVRIRDRRLGLLHYFFMIGVFLYIIIYTMLMQKSYLFIKEASGTIRYLNEIEARYPGEELDALFLTTRIKYQVAQPEMYTLWMDHAMTPDGF